MLQDMKLASMLVVEVVVNDHIDPQTICCLIDFPRTKRGPVCNGGYCSDLHLWLAMWNP